MKATRILAADKLDDAASIVGELLSATMTPRVSQSRAVLAATLANVSRGPRDLLQVQATTIPS